MDETLAEELERLLEEYRGGDHREEAWNLIADFAVDNGAFLLAALRLAEKLKPVAEAAFAPTPADHASS